MKGKTPPSQQAAPQLSPAQQQEAQALGLDPSMFNVGNIGRLLRFLADLLDGFGLQGQQPPQTP